MNNYERIKAMSINTMAETISNYASVCAFLMLDGVFKRTNIENIITDENKKQYRQDLFNIALDFLQKESEVEE